MRHLLWDWLGNLVAWLITISAVLAVYGLGRYRGRAAEREKQAEFAAQVNAMFGDTTVPIPLQREASR